MATSCTSPTVTSSTRGGRLGQARFPPRLLLTPRRLLRRTLRALQHLDVDDALASTRARREWSDAAPRALRRDAMRPQARRRHPRWGARLSSRSSPTGCATLRQHTLHSPAPTWRRMRTCPATTCWRSGTSSPPPMMSRIMARPASSPLPLRPRTGMPSRTSPAYRTQ
jgi:hypothetical protein